MKYIDLRNKNLIKLPDNIDIDVEYLDLSHNNLCLLPENFALFKNLKILFLSNNNFIKIPKVLLKLKNLFMLSFRNNNLIEVNNIPNSIKWLILTNNYIDKIDSLGHLIHLRKLMLSGNLLKLLPDDIEKCQEIELIRLSNNKFENVPIIIFKLNNLAWISMANNPCFSLPKLPSKIDLIKKNKLLLKEKIGEGTAGIVYKSSFNNCDVAVKHYKGLMTSDGLATNEIYNLCSIKPHNNLIEICGLLYENEKSNIQGCIMHLFNNYKQISFSPSFQTITRDIYNKNNNDDLKIIENKNNIIQQIEDVLNYLHKNNIIHGDFYGHNIIYNKEKNHCVLTDFGASFIISDQSLLNEFIKIEKRAFSIFKNELLSKIK